MSGKTPEPEKKKIHLSVRCPWCESQVEDDVLFYRTETGNWNARLQHTTCRNISRIWMSAAGEVGPLERECCVTPSKT